MKTLLIALATGSLMLAACSSSKPAEEAAAPRVTVEEAMTQCQQASGENADRAVFDACMKDKGYQRTAESAASEPAASEPVAAPEAVAPEAAASEPAAKAAPATAIAAANSVIINSSFLKINVSLLYVRCKPLSTYRIRTLE